METMNSKSCTSCLRTLPLEMYAKAKLGKLGRAAACKDCMRVQIKAWSQSAVGRESRRKACVRYRLSSHGQQKRAEYRKTESNRTIQKRWIQSEAGKANQSKYRKSQKRKDALKRYYQSGKGRAAIARYQATPEGKESLLRGVHRRRARMAQIESTLTRQEWLAILKKHQNKCVYCGRGDVQLTRDHVIPLAQGGHHIKENIVPACRSCNSRKNKHFVLRPT